MFVLENGDKLQGDASAATVVDYHISGITGGTTLKNLADGQLAATIGDLYTSASTDAATTITLVNTDSVARTVNLYHTPSGGTARRVIPKDLSLSAGYSVVIDGGDIKIIGTDGKLQTTAALGASEIKTLYESNSDTNAFTDAEKTLLGNQSGTNTGDEPSASDAVSGIVELATIAEVDTGTDTARAITPAGLAGSALQAKLDGIEALADVTDATNVDAAGATMNTDADVSGNTWVVDEDDLASDSATKVPTQQSVKAYTDSGTQTLTNKTIGAATISGTIAAADNNFERVELKDYAITFSAIGNTGSTQTFDLETANAFSATLDQACAFTFSNPPATGNFGSFVLELTNGDAYTITWPASVDWAGGSAPTLTSSGVDILAFVTRDGGTTWHGYVMSTDSK